MRNYKIALIALASASALSMGVAHATAVPSVQMRVYSTMGQVINNQHRVTLTEPGQVNSGGTGITTNTITCSTNGNCGGFENIATMPSKYNPLYQNQWPTITLHVLSAGGSNGAKSTQGTFQLNINQIAGTPEALATDSRPTLILVGDAYAKDTAKIAQCTASKVISQPAPQAPLVVCFAKDGTNPWN